MHVSDGMVYRRFSGPDLYLDQFYSIILLTGITTLLSICYTLITQYYDNITQLDVKCLHLIRYSTLPNCGPRRL